MVSLHRFLVEKWYTPLYISLGRIMLGFLCNHEFRNTEK